jgi:hypothetical protein
MAYLSELIISHPEITSYGGIEDLVVQAAKDGLVLLYFDVKPDFPDTPRDWHKRLEETFYRAERIKRDHER